MDYKDITIIALLYKTPVKLLENLRKYRNFKMLIIDQSNDLTNKIYLKKFLPNIKYYGLTNKNMGFAKAQNLLIKKVKTKYFFSTQPDVNISVNSIINLKKTIIKFKKDCILAVPKINNQKNITKFYKKNNKKKEFKINDMIGASFMADKKKFIKIGMFDANFFFYWEDIDLNYRINMSNYKIVSDQKAKATHLSGKSTYNGFKERYIRGVNFKYGEFLFLFKNKKLRFLKIFREIILNLVRFFLNLIFLRLGKCEVNIFNLIGIIKFLNLSLVFIKKFFYFRTYNFNFFKR